MFLKNFLKDGTEGEQLAAVVTSIWSLVTMIYLEADHQF